MEYSSNYSPPPVPILSQINPSYDPSFHFLKIHLISSSHLHLRLQSGLFPSGFPTKTLYAYLLCPTSATNPAHLILNWITRIIFGEEYRLSPSLCSFLHSPVTLSLVGPNKFLSILFSKNLQPTFLHQ